MSIELLDQEMLQIWGGVELNSLNNKLNTDDTTNYENSHIQIMKDSL